MAQANNVAFTITAQDLASPIMAKVREGSRGLVGEAGALNSVFGRTDGARKFSNALENVAFQSLGASGKLGSLAQGLSSLALGSPVMLGVTAGVTALAGLWHLLAGKTDEAKKRTDDLTRSLLQQAAAAREATLQGQQDILKGQQGKLDSFLSANVPAYLRGNQAAIDSYLQQHGDKLKQYRDLLQAVAVAQQNVLNAGSNIGRPEITIHGGSSLIGGGRGGLSDLDRELNKIATLFKGTAAKGGTFGTPLPFGQFAQYPGESGGGPLTPMFNAIQTQIGEMVDYFANQAGPMLGDAVANAFGRAFSGEGFAGLFKGFAQSILASIGSVFVEVGKSMMAASGFIDAFRAALSALIPGGGFLAGAGLVALGGSMGGLASGLGRSGGGSLGGGYSGGYYSGGAAFTRQASPVILNLNGAPYLDLRDPETRDKISSLISEVSRGTRQLQLGGTGLSRA